MERTTGQNAGTTPGEGEDDARPDEGTTARPDAGPDPRPDARADRGANDPGRAPVTRPDPDLGTNAGDEADPKTAGDLDDEALFETAVVGAPDPDRDRSFWPRYRKHFHIGLWSTLTVVLVGLFLMLASMSLTGRVIVLPDWVAERVETRLNEALPEGQITLRRFEIGVTPKGNPRLRLIDVGLRDASGLDIAQFNSIQGGVRLWPLLSGRLVPRTAVLSGAQITFRRLADGGFALRFGQGDTATGSLGEMIDAVDAAFVEGIFAQAAKVSANGLTITLEDSRSGRLWQVTDGRLDLTHTDKIIETRVLFDVFNQTEELAVVDLTLRSDKITSRATLSVAFENAGAADIGAQSPALSFLQLIDAPVAGALRTTIGDGGELAGLAGVLSIDEGAVRPTPGAKPVGFGGAKGYVDYDPEQDVLNLSSFTFLSDLGEIEMGGRLFFTDHAAGWPQTIVGQFNVRRALLNDPELFDAPLVIQSGFADARLHLSPFRLDVGQAVLFHDDTRYELSGAVRTAGGGYDLSLGLKVPKIALSELKSVWPRTVQPPTRAWVFDRMLEGEVEDLHIALKGESLATADALIGGYGRDLSVRFMPQMPPAERASGYFSLAEGRFLASIDEGVVRAPGGRELAVKPSTFMIPDVGAPGSIGHLDLRVAGPVPAALELLDLEPFEIFKGTDFGPDVATGRVNARVKAEFALLKNLPKEDVRFTVNGRLFDVVSDRILPGSTLTAKQLRLSADQSLLKVSGDAMIGDNALTMTWRQPLNDDSPVEFADVSGQIALGEALNEEFNLGIGPRMLSGAGTADFRLKLRPGTAPVLNASSTLAGVTMAIPGTGWSKPASATGKLTLRAELGAQPKITAFDIEAPGLSATGRVTTKEGGQLDRAVLSRVRLGGWLDAPVTITGRGSAPVAISVTGGRADLRGAGFDMGGGGAGGGNGPSEPLAIRLDELVIAQSIVLQNFNAHFDLAGGLSGKFTADVANGAPINGTVVQSAQGAAYKIQSQNGGLVLKGLGIFSQARGGRLEIVMVPNGEPGTFEGDMVLANTRLVDAPTVAEMLSTLSIVGLIDQLNGEGIGFSEVKARFRLTPRQVVLYSSSAVSPSLGLSMDGYYNLDSSTMDMQGVLSPFYLINSLGRVVSARDGEGLVGFAFNLSGPDDDLSVAVNPLSVLMPGVLREIFRRQSPQQPGGSTQ